MNEDLMAYILEIIFRKQLKKETGTDWIALFVKNNEAIYFDSFGIEHIPNEINKLLAIKILKVIYLDYKYMI